MQTHIKLLLILWIYTILNISTIYSTEKVVLRDGYFYKNMSYEGFAGYCAIITPKLTKVSNKMKTKLNISHHSPNHHSHKTQQSYTTQNNNNNNNNSTTNNKPSFASITESYSNSFNN